jgi:hypothetical protein
MTKDPKEHRRFLVYIPQYAVKNPDKILEQMEKKTSVPWEVNMEETDTRYLAVQTVGHEKLRKILLEASPNDEKAFVNWRMKWKNEKFEIATGK